jgi:septal ring factor EnvC (AmiA/AmiB activator)
MGGVGGFAVGNAIQNQEIRQAQTQSQISRQEREIERQRREIQRLQTEQRSG